MAPIRSSGQSAGLVLPSLQEDEDPVPISGKSCLTCHKRKVKCDRLGTGCLRCKKRGEVCQYDALSVMTLRPPPFSQTPTVVPKFPPPTRQKAPRRKSTSSLSSSSSTSQVSSTSASNRAYNNLPPPSPPLAPSDFQTSTNRTVSLWMNGVVENPARLQGSLEKSAMSKELIINLLQASKTFKGLHLKGFRNLQDRVPYFCDNFERLTGSEQVAVSILTAMGLCVGPSSAFIGGTPSEFGAFNQALKISAATRRENAWKYLIERALVQCTQSDILHVPSETNVEVLIALSNVLLFSEVLPDRARLYHRIAVGLFRDYVQSSSPSDSELASFKKRIVPSLYELDCHIAAYGSLPLQLIDAELLDTFDDSGVYVPDLHGDDLENWLCLLFSSPGGKLNSQLVSSALSQVEFFVCALQRDLAKITSAPRRSNTFLTQFEQLWSKIDKVHSALQHLRIFLSQHPQSGDTSMDLVHALRLDIYLIDLFNLSYHFLEEQKDRFDLVLVTRAFNELLDLSLKRVRKGLKLMGFYVNLSVEGADQHALYPIFVRMDIIPWVKLACQRVGEENGPSSPEYEVSDTELDWIKEGLESASHLATLACDRLEELSVRRGDIIVDLPPQESEISSFPLPPLPTEEASTLAPRMDYTYKPYPSELLSLSASSPVDYFTLIESANTPVFLEELGLVPERFSNVDVGASSLFSPEELPRKRSKANQLEEVSQNSWMVGTPPISEQVWDW